MPSGSITKSCGRRKFTWFEGQAELVRRIPLVEREAYDHTRAYDHLNAIKGVKPLLRCKIYCLTDGINVKKASHFGQKPPRKFYPYKDIHRFYAFADSPHILTLGCADPEKGTKHYEFFELEENQVQELCQLIERAHKDPMYRLVDDDTGLARYQSSQSSLAGDTDTAPDDSELKKTATNATASSDGEMVQPEDSIQSNSVDPVSSAPDDYDIHLESTSPVQNAMEKPTSPLNSVPDYLRNDPLFHSLCANIDEREVLSVDLKYIEPDAIMGNQIAESGAIYVFVAHHKRPEHVEHCNGTDDCMVCHEENTAELGFSTAFTSVKTDS